MWSRRQTPGRCLPLAWRPHGRQADGVPAPPERPEVHGGVLALRPQPLMAAGACRRSPASPGDPALRLWDVSGRDGGTCPAVPWVRAWASRGCGETGVRGKLVSLESTEARRPLQHGRVLGHGSSRRTPRDQQRAWGTARPLAFLIVEAGWASRRHRGGRSGCPSGLR